MKKFFFLCLILGVLAGLVVSGRDGRFIEATNGDTVVDSFNDETKIESKEGLYVNTTAGQVKLKALGATCYCDKDGDTYFATTPTTVPTLTCAESGCSSKRGNDCDDNDASIYPGVRVGSKDCSGNNTYFISGTQSPTTTSYCQYRAYDDQPIICQNDGTYSDPTCNSYKDKTLKKCGACQYVDQCNASSQTCANYPNGTKYSSCKWCQNGGIANVPYGQDPFNDCYPNSSQPCRGNECNGSGGCTVLPAGREDYCIACTKCDGRREACFLGPQDLYAAVCCDKYPDYSKDTTPGIIGDPYGRYTCDTCCYNGKCDPKIGEGQWSECLTGSTYMNMSCKEYCESKGLICGKEGWWAGICYESNDCSGAFGSDWRAWAVLYETGTCSDTPYGIWRSVKFYCRNSICP